MTIQGLGTSAAYGSNSAQKSKTSGIDGEIQSLKDQKELIQKQIKKYKTDKDANSDAKQKLIKNLEDQITQIDAQIQAKQIERAKEQVTTAADSASQAKSQKSAQNNQTGIQQGLSQDTQKAISQIGTYNKLGKLASMSKLSKTKAAELESDAKVQADAGDATGAAKLYTEGAKLLAQSNSELSSAAKQAAKIDGTAGKSEKGALSKITEKKKEETDNQDDSVKKEKDKQSNSTVETAE